MTSATMRNAVRCRRDDDDTKRAPKGGALLYGEKEEHLNRPKWTI